MYSKEKFEEGVKLIFQKFEKKNFPFKYWHEIVTTRSDSMKNFTMGKSIDQIRKEWEYGHYDEYKVRFQDSSTKDKKEAVEIRLKAFGNIYKNLKDLQAELNDFVKLNNISANPFLDTFDWDLASCLASLNGTILFALKHADFNMEQINKYW